MYDNTSVAILRPVENIEKIKLIKNTYLLLSATLFFSCLMAMIAVMTHVTHVNILLFIAGSYGLLFVTHYLKNSSLGILSVFCFTGFMGYALGPILNMVLHLNNGVSIIMVAFGSTGAIFLSLSAYALITKKDFSYLIGFLMVGLLTVLLTSLANLILGLPILNLAISALFVLVSSGLILYDTSRIINGGETNYIIATISLYISIYNLFISLLQLMTALRGRE